MTIEKRLPVRKSLLKNPTTHYEWCPPTQQSLDLLTIRKEPSTMEFRTMGGEKSLFVLFIAGLLLSGVQVNAQEATTQGVQAHGMAVEEVPVHEMPVDPLPVHTMLVDEVPVHEMPVDPLPVHTMLVDEMPVQEVTAVSFSIDESAQCLGIIGSSALIAPLENGFIGEDPCSHGLLDFACADLSTIAATSTEKIIQCILTRNNIILTQASASLFFSKLPLDKLKDALQAINSQVPALSTTANARSIVFNAIWERFKSSPSTLSPGFVAVWFQEYLFSFLGAINSNILDSMTQLPLSCDAFHSVVDALNLVYSDFEIEERQMIGNWITQFIQTHSCRRSTAADFIHYYYRSFFQDVGFASFKLAWHDIDLSGSLNILTSVQVAQYAIDSNAFTGQGNTRAVLQLLEGKDLLYIADFIETISRLSGSSASYDLSALHSLLALTLYKLNTPDGQLCKPSLNVIFQRKLNFILVTINADALSLLPADLDCSDFHNIFGGVDLVYNQLDETNQLAVFNYIYNYLLKQVERTGSACACDYTDGAWLQINFGHSISHLSFSQIIHLNSEFNAFQSLSVLTVQQTVDALIYHNILTDVEVVEYESHVSAVTTVFESRGYEYVEEFLITLHTTLVENHVEFVANEDVCSLFLENIWRFLVTHFPTYSHNDWYNWFNKYIPAFLSCIRKTQLDTLTLAVVQDCSNFRVITQGFNLGFAHMSPDVRNFITDWIISILRLQQCPDNDWLNYNFFSFESIVEVTTIIELNPTYDVIANLEAFTVEQIAQVVFVEESCRYSVEVITQVFDAIVLNVTTTEAIENLNVFWEGFNEIYTESIVFEYAVQYEMLERTTTQLEYSYSTFTDESYSIWFEQNLHSVEHTINAEILNEIPLTISCASYGSIVSGLSSVYEKTQETNREDVYHFCSSYLTRDDQCVESSLSLITTNLGSYRGEATYVEIKSFYSEFNIFEQGVIQHLTSTQIGDAILYERITENLESSTQLVRYLETVSVSEVTTCFAQFTQTAIENNVEVTNVESGTYLLNSYLGIIREEIEFYSTEQINILFTERIHFFIRFFTRESLSLLFIRDCNSLSIVVTHLSSNFNYFSKEILRSIVEWILNLLRSVSFHGGCSENHTSATWVATYFSSLSIYAEVKEFSEIFHGFDFETVIESASVNQKAEYIVTSGALTNITRTEVVLNSFEESVSVSSTIEFLEVFNAGYSELTTQYIENDVREACMSFFFNSWTENLNSLTEEQSSSFGTYFQYFISGSTVEVVNSLSVHMNCNNYRNIISAFSKHSKELSEDVRQALFDFIQSFLNANFDSSSGFVCSSLYTDSRSFINNIYYEFRSYESFYQWEYYYEQFNAYEVLDLCSGTQLGNLFLNTTAYENTFEAVQILLELKTRSEIEVSEFVAEFNVVAEERHITRLEDESIQTMTFETVYEKLDGEISGLSVLLTSISVETINEMTFTADCSHQISVVQSFSGVYDRLSGEQIQAITGRVYDNLVKIKGTTGSACDTGKSSTEWLVEVFGQLAENIEIQKFTELNENFNALEAVSELSATQAAGFLVSAGGLESAEVITAVFESFTETSEVYECLTHLNSIAAEELRSSSQVSLILDLSIDVIESSYQSFTTEEWGNWYQGAFQNILYAINETELRRFPFPLRCDNYQQVLQGFNNAYILMSENTRESVFQYFVKAQLDSTITTTGVACGETTQRTQEWLDVNCGLFVEYAEFSSLLSWNTEFSVTEVISSLSVEQLAVVCLESSNINNEELACQVAGRIQQSSVSDITVFVTGFNVGFEKLQISELPNQVIEHKFLSSVITGVKSFLISFSVDQWDSFLVSIKIFFRSIDDSLLEILLDSASCDSYPIIVRTLDDVFDRLSVENQKSSFNLLYGFLKRKYTGSGSACGISDESNSDWLWRVFRRYSGFGSLVDFSSINSNFNGLDAIGHLNSQQLAELSFSGDILTNAQSANILIGALQSSSQISAFLSSFNAFAQGKGIISLQNNDVTVALLSHFYSSFSVQFSSFSDSQTISFWHSISLFLGRISRSQIEQISSNHNLGCGAFQYIISLLSQHFEHLSSDSRDAGYIFAKNFLTNQNEKTGSACASQGSGSAALLQANFGSFRVFAGYQFFVQLYADFNALDALSLLNEGQLAWYCVQSSTLRDTDKVKFIMSRVASLNIGLFLDEFNKFALEAGLTQLPNVNVRDLMLTETFCQLSQSFLSFAASDYSNFFGERLRLLLSGIGAKTLGFLPRDLTCDSLAAIVQAFSNHPHLEHSEDIFNFIDSVLETQQTNSGSACTGGLGGREWFIKYFGSFRIYGSWERFSFYYHSIHASEVSDLLSETQLASASVSSSVINNVTAISSFFISFPSDPAYLLQYIESIRTYALLNPDLLSNAKVRDSILFYVAQNVFSTVEDLSLHDWENWLSKTDFLLAGVNSTMLEYLGVNIPCSHYQAFVKALDKKYSNLLNSKKKEIYDYAKLYLAHQGTTYGNPCATSDVSDTFDYINVNLYRFCREGTANDIQAFYPDLDSVSYTRLCAAA